MANIPPDDPRLTAYTLGEMGPEERAVFEAELAADPELRRQVQEIQEVSDVLAMALSAEPLPEIDLRAETLGAQKPPLSLAARSARVPERRRLPAVWSWWGGLAAAAALALAALPWVWDLGKTPGEAGETAALAPRGSAADAGPAAEAALRVKLQVDPRLRTSFVAAAEHPEAWLTPETAREHELERRRQLFAGRSLSQGPWSLDELLARFSTHLPVPAEGEPIAAEVEAADAPWAPGHRLVRVAVRTREGASGQLAVRLLFDPARVEAYRIIGYDGGPEAGGDAGGVGLVALCEVIPAAQAGEVALADTSPELRIEVAGLDPLRGASRMQAQALALVPGESPKGSPSAEIKFSAAVAGFSLLQNPEAMPVRMTYDDVLRLAKESLAMDPRGYRKEFVDMVVRARAMSGSPAQPAEADAAKEDASAQNPPTASAGTPP